MGRKRKEEKTVTISFRVSESAFRAIQEDAKRNKVSVNTFVNQLFMSYSDFDRHMKKFHPIKLSSPTFKRITAATSDEAVPQAGASAGSSVPESFILAKAGELSVQNAVDFLKAMATYANLFEYSDVPRGEGKKRIVTLTHDFGPRWSTFVAHCLDSVFKDIEGEAKVVQHPDAVILELPDSGPLIPFSS